ncbi:type IV secretory system conjugative DNA transfer family protein [uncultured Parasutterella sp.]|uniref:type IV secretory system conjugative DNA transfer family protein n=1 Tax=uncultured Parasutterella sp. TaxID=1263098 RepID=UPI0026336EED|nr:type IV secretory system conjugative DNA transfer family protein [uncultured Parasutterella sp.]
MKDEFTEAAIGEDAHVTTVSLYAEHLRRTKEKAEKKKSVRKSKKKKKKKKKNLPIPMERCEEAEECLSFGHEIISSPETSLLSQNQRVSERIRCAQGRVIPEHFRLRLDADSGVFFGLDRDHGYYVGKSSTMDGHICVIGESGRGKTESIVKPTILTYQNGSTIVFDFKDNLHKHWISTARSLGKRSVVFWPDGPVGCSCHYDPLEPMRRNNSANIVAATTDLAYALIPLPDGTKEPIWIETAQNYLIGVIIYYYFLDMNFPEIMMLILNTPVTEMIKNIMQDDVEEATLAKIFINKLTDVDPKIVSNIGMELNRLAFFVADQNLMDLLTPTENDDLLDWEAISKSVEPIDVFISVPESKLDYYKPILRLMANQLIRTLEQRPQRTFSSGTELPPILVLMDEFSRLGKFPAITSGLMTLRSAGVTFAIFIQSIASLDEIYGHTTARVILDNCSYKVILGASDVESQQYLSNLVGSVATPQGSISESYNMFTNQVIGYSRNIGVTLEPVIYPQEFSSMTDVVVVSPDGYFRIDKIPYYSRKELFTQLALLPRYKRYMEEYDRTHAISALPERSSHEES